MQLAEIEQIIREHSTVADPLSLNAWLTEPTLARFRDWVPRSEAGQTTLLDIGCYQPAIGYYVALGWSEVIGIAKEAGECNAAHSYVTEQGSSARNLVLDVETERIPLPDASVDVVLMMEVFEHFGVDPMHGLAETNRVLKPGGLLVFSTPNATAFGDLFRMMQGKAPHVGLEFSGFSTNRHNRIYDCSEVREIMRSAGFTIETCTSRSYYNHELPPKAQALRLVSRFFDAWLRLRRGWQIERGEYLFVRARKSGEVLNRYPRTLYFDPANWPSWFRAIGGECVLNRPSS